MHKTLFILALGSLVFCGCTAKESASVQYKPGWNVYRNDRYGYEIQYPEGHEVRETGKEGERDGATLMIIKEEYAAPAPALYVELYPQVSVQEWLEEVAAADSPNVTVSVGDVEINGMSGKQLEYWGPSNEKLGLVELYFDDVTFRIHLLSDTDEVEGTLEWEMMTTFRFLDT
jgi:hypothetical protein